MIAVFLPKTKLEKAAPEDKDDREERPALGSIYYDPEAERWVVADGYILAVVPALVKEATADAGDGIAAMIPYDAWCHIRETEANAIDIDDTARQVMLVLDGGAQIHRYRLTEGQYIKYREIIPEFKEGDDNTITIALDAKKLWRLAQAIREEDEHRGHYGVRITVDTTDDSKPVRVEPLERELAGHIGVIMPMLKGPDIAP